MAEQYEASEYLIEKAMKDGDGDALRFVKVLMDARDAAIAGSSS